MNKVSDAIGGLAKNQKGAYWDKSGGAARANLQKGMKTNIKKQSYFPRQKKATPSILNKPSKGSSKKKVNGSAPTVGKTAQPFHARLTTKKLA